MSVKVDKVERVFRYNGRDLPDPDPSMSPEEVLKLYARQYPNLTNGEVSGAVYEGTSEVRKLEGKGHYRLSGGYGTKG